ncbi:MAG: SAM-dependent methyltransferase [Steroidobacteraceae bacterium]|nr:SAM-dependent methyltransferase [Steroidobacteraceae bacterium]
MEDAFDREQWRLLQRELTGAYRHAIERVIGPGDVVLTAGDGFGLFGLEACRIGAARVYALAGGRFASVISAIAAENGVADRLVSFPANSFDVALPERAWTQGSDY